MSPDKKLLILKQHNEAIKINHWRISIRLGINSFRDGYKPHLMFDQLATLGDIVSVQLVTSIIPSLESYDPEGCYLGWDLILNSKKSKKTIASVFTILEGAKVSILPPTSLIPSYQNRLKELSTKDEILGGLLSSIDAITENELQQALNYQKVNGGLIGDILVAQEAIQIDVIDSALEKQEKIKEKKLNEMNSVNIDSEKLNKLVTLVGELFIRTENMSHVASLLKDDDLNESTEEMTLILNDMRDTTSSVQMVPISNVFQHLIQNIPKEFDKKVQFEIIGEQTKLDKTIVDKIVEPLQNIVRNAIEHGVDSSAERLKSGKTETGVIIFKAYQETGMVVIEVSDDGSGLDPEKLLHIAKQRGIVSKEQSLYEDEIYNLIFEAGFSSAQSRSNVTCRGSGMDIVRRGVESLRGTVSVDSTKGKGVTVTLRLPLSLSIIDAVHLSVANESFILPREIIIDRFLLNSGQLIELESCDFFDFNDDVIPIIKMNDYLNVRATPKMLSLKTLVVVQFENTKVGLLVDEIHGEVQVVVKPLGGSNYGTSGLAGFTILASGELALILDVPKLIKSTRECENDKNMPKLYA